MINKESLEKMRRTYGNTKESIHNDNTHNDGDNSNNVNNNSNIDENVNNNRM